MRLSRTYQGFLDALPDATALVDTDGVIRAINAAWKRFTAENDGDTKTYYLDRNYFSVCDATTAESGTLSSEVALGLSAILRRSKTEFRCEYPCHSPQEKRWFEVLIAPLQIEGESLRTGHA